MKAPPRIAGQPADTQVDFYLTSRGNHFITEIARVFQEGFEALGLKSSLRFDEVPSGEVEAGRLRILVAPHELIPLFLVQKLARRELYAAVSNCYLLNTEQPGSAWFETAFRFARRARGVFDINRGGVAEFRQRGVPAVYTPLGYAPSLEEGTAADHQTKDIDIVFLGHHSPKRALFLARHADRLAKFDCRLMLADVERPRLPTTPNVLAGAKRNRLLRRSKILINVHSAKRKYFEWHRILCAMANHCLVISEQSRWTDPLVDRRHLILSDREHLVDHCEEYLRNEAVRHEMTRQTYRFLRNEMPIENTCRTMLKSRLGPPAPDGAFARPAPVSPAASPLRQIGYAANGRLRFAGQYLRRLPAECKRFLRRQPLAHHLYYSARSSYGRLRGRWSLGEIESRRRAIIRRLQLAETRPADEPGAGYELVANRRYQESVSPAVSVIVTVYNYAEFVVDCLESVARSRAENLPGGWEVLVIDDASTDASAEVAEQTIRRPGMPACVVRKSWNTGLADARNLGIKLARSPFVFILDADNLIYPSCLAKLYETLHASKAAGAYGPLKRFDHKTGKGLGLFSWFPWDVPRLLRAPYIDGMAMLDREKVLSVGGYSTELIRCGWFGWEDYDLWLKFARANYWCAFRPEILAAYRVHGSSMINVTQYYKPRLFSYFQEKFADLLRGHPSGRMQFGSPVA